MPDRELSVIEIKFEFEFEVNQMLRILFQIFFPVVKNGRTSNPLQVLFYAKLNYQFH